MDYFTIELVSSASSELFPDNTLSSFTNFIPELVNLDDQWEVEVSEISYSSLYQNVTEGKFLFYEENFSKTKDFYLEPGQYPSISDFVEAMNSLIQNKQSRQHLQQSGIVAKNRKKNDVSLVNQESCLVISSLDLEFFLEVWPTTWNF